MITSPSSRKATGSWTSAWVPTTRWSDPDESSACASRRWRAGVEPVSSVIRKREDSSSLRIVMKCCSARISVGAMNATWNPFSIATTAAISATIVLPDPTSPCSSRFIGELRCMSATISAIAFFWSPVSRNGRTRRTAARISSVIRTARGFCSASARRFRRISPS